MLQNFEAVSVFLTETIEHKGFDDLNIQRGLVILEIETVPEPVRTSYSALLSVPLYELYMLTCSRGFDCV